MHAHQNSRFVSPVNAHALLFKHYFFVFRLVRSVLQAVSASQMAFSLFPRRTKHLFDFMDKVQSWKSLETNHSFSSLNSTIICPSQTVSISFIDIQYVVILLAYYIYSTRKLLAPGLYCCVLNRNSQLKMAHLMFSSLIQWLLCFTTS